MTWKGWEDFVPSVLHGRPRRSKYGAVKTEADGVVFASKREADRYRELMSQRQRCVITHLELQPQFPLTVLTPDGTAIVIGRYIADFRYQRDGRDVIEDAKGMKTDMYRWKKRHVEAQYGIEIEEV